MNTLNSQTKFQANARASANMHLSSGVRLTEDQNKLLLQEIGNYMSVYERNSKTELQKFDEVEHVTKRIRLGSDDWSSHCAIHDWSSHSECGQLSEESFLHEQWSESMHGVGKYSTSPNMRMVNSYL